MVYLMLKLIFPLLMFVVFVKEMIQAVWDVMAWLMVLNMIIVMFVEEMEDLAPFFVVTLIVMIVLNMVLVTVDGVKLKKHVMIELTKLSLVLKALPQVNAPIYFWDSLPLKQLVLELVSSL